MTGATRRCAGLSTAMLPGDRGPIGSSILYDQQGRQEIIAAALKASLQAGSGAPRFALRLSRALSE